MIWGKILEEDCDFQAQPAFKAQRQHGHAGMVEPTEPSPLHDAQERLSKLAAAGVPVARVTLEVGELISGWASEMDMAAAVAQARIDLLWDGFTRDAAELQEQISDAGDADTPALTLARRQLAALQAIVVALEAAHAKLTGPDESTA